MVESHEAIGSFAVDALEEPSADLEGHLIACGLCAREMAEFFETLGELSRTSSTAPPPRLRIETLSTIRTLNEGLSETAASRSLAVGCALLLVVAALVWLLG